MARPESEPDMVIRHVRDGQQYVDRQREIVENLTAARRPSDIARELLAALEHSQALHRRHLAQLQSR
jgi:hypothetical protein